MERNHLIDSLKLFCALLVVFIHCEYPYRLAVLPITDIAVPLFFALSGFFIFGSKHTWKRIGRIANIFVWSALLYLMKTEFFHLLSVQHLWIPTWKNFLDLLLFNNVAFSIHLWYLPAYIYVLVIAFVIDRYGIWRWAFSAIIPLLALGGFIKYYIADVSPQCIYYYRNAFFVGLPYFLLGSFAKYTPPHQCNINSLKSMSYSVVSCAIMFLLLGLRYNILGNSLSAMVLKELNLLIMVYLIVLYVTITKQKMENNISSLGCRYSLYIYVFHVLIMQICELLSSYLPDSIEITYMYFHPMVVFALSIAFTYILGRLRLIKL